MDCLTFRNGVYRTGDVRVSPFSKLFPELPFYSKIISIILTAGRLAKQGKYDTAAWCKSSRDTIHALESVGIQIEISGIEYVQYCSGPCVFIANHMSTLETFVLPSLIAPIKGVTFVIKKSLLDYPVFKHVMHSRDPIAVGRTNPRDDLKVVIEEGVKRLTSGISVIVFPQARRRFEIDPRTFNSIGVKLAKRAEVPIIPIALKTDAWGNGRYAFNGDFGKIDPSKKVYFAFGEPLRVRDRGVEEHEAVLSFIQRKLKEWGK